MFLINMKLKMNLVTTAAFFALNFLQFNYINKALVPQATEISHQVWKFTELARSATDTNRFLLLAIIISHCT